MPNAEKETVRRSIICTFDNHPPIRFWGEFNAEAIEVAKRETKYGPGDYIDHYVSTLWDANRDFGHRTIDYYVCKSGKRIYYVSHNSGESYGSHSPKTTRTYLKDAAAIERYLTDVVDVSEWHRVSHKVDPTLIVDSDLL